MTTASYNQRRCGYSQLVSLSELKCSSGANRSLLVNQITFHLFFYIHDRITIYCCEFKSLLASAKNLLIPFIQLDRSWLNIVIITRE